LDSPSKAPRRLFDRTNNPIEKAVRGVGVKWAKTITNTYNLTQMLGVLHKASAC